VNACHHDREATREADWRNDLVAATQRNISRGLPKGLNPRRYTLHSHESLKIRRWPSFA
jgi:hypothetical protein